MAATVSAPSIRNNQSQLEVDEPRDSAGAPVHQIESRGGERDRPAAARDGEAVRNVRARLAARERLELVPDRHALIELPQLGKVESLNVATAAAALLYGILHSGRPGLDNVR